MLQNYYKKIPETKTSPGSSPGSVIAGVKSLPLTLFSSRNRRRLTFAESDFYDGTFLARDIIPVSGFLSRGKKEEQERGKDARPIDLRRQGHRRGQTFTLTNLSETAVAGERGEFKSFQPFKPFNV